MRPRPGARPRPIPGLSFSTSRGKAALHGFTDASYEHPQTPRNPRRPQERHARHPCRVGDEAAGGHPAPRSARPLRHRLTGGHHPAGDLHPLAQPLFHRAGGMEPNLPRASAKASHSPAPATMATWSPAPWRSSASAPSADRPHAARWPPWSASSAPCRMASTSASHPTARAARAIRSSPASSSSPNPPARRSFPSMCVFPPHGA